MRTCEICAWWDKYGYTVYLEFGNCWYSETEDGFPKFEDALIIGAGTWGQSYACTHRSFCCPNWKMNDEQTSSNTR